MVPETGHVSVSGVLKAFPGQFLQYSGGVPDWKPDWEQHLHSARLWVHGTVLLGHVLVKPFANMNQL